MIEEFSHCLNHQRHRLLDGTVTKSNHQLFELGKREFDREKRGKIYAEIHERVYDAQPYTFLFYRSSFYGFNKRLRGYNFSPRGPDGYGPGYSALWKPLE